MDMMIIQQMQTIERYITGSKRMLISYHLNKNESLYFCYLQKKMENKEKNYESKRIHNGIRCR